MSLLLNIGYMAQKSLQHKKARQKLSVWVKQAHNKGGCENARDIETENFALVSVR